MIARIKKLRSSKGDFFILFDDIAIAFSFTAFALLWHAAFKDDSSGMIPLWLYSLFFGLLAVVPTLGSIFSQIQERTRLGVLRCSLACAAAVVFITLDIGLFTRYENLGIAGRAVILGVGLAVLVRGGNYLTVVLVRYQNGVYAKA
jgi:integral membrane sensor domain MASE1